MYDQENDYHLETISQQEEHYNSIMESIRIEHESVGNEIAYLGFNYKHAKAHKGSERYSFYVCDFEETQRVGLHSCANIFLVIK